MGCGSAKVAQSSTTHGDSRNDRGREDTGNSRHGYSRNSYNSGSAGTSKQSQKGSLFKQSASENDFSTVTSISGTSRIRVTLSNDGSLLEVETEKLEVAPGLGLRQPAGNPDGRNSDGDPGALDGAQGGSGTDTSRMEVVKNSLRGLVNDDRTRPTIHASLPNLQYGINGTMTNNSVKGVSTAGSSCTCSCTSSDSRGSAGQCPSEINRRPHSTGQQNQIHPETTVQPHHPTGHHYYHTIRPYCQVSAEKLSAVRQAACGHKTDVPSASQTAVPSFRNASPTEKASKGILLKSRRTRSKKSSKKNIVSAMSSNNSSCHATQSLCVCCSGVTQSPLGPSDLRKTYDTSIEEGGGALLIEREEAGSRISQAGEARVNCDSHHEMNCTHGNYKSGSDCHARHYHVLTTSSMVGGNDSGGDGRGVSCPSLSTSTDSSSTSSASNPKYQPLVSEENNGRRAMAKNASDEGNGNKCPPTPTHHGCYKNSTLSANSAATTESDCEYAGSSTERCCFSDSDITQAQERLLRRNGEEGAVHQNRNKPTGDYYQVSRCTAASSLANNAAASNHTAEDGYTERNYDSQNAEACPGENSYECASGCLVTNGTRPGQLGHSNTSKESKGSNVRDTHYHKQCQHSLVDNYHCVDVSPSVEADAAVRQSCSAAECTTAAVVGKEGKGCAHHYSETCVTCSMGSHNAGCQTDAEQFHYQCDPGHCDILSPHNSNNMFVDDKSANATNSIHRNQIIVKPEIHNYDSSGFSFTDVNEDNSNEIRTDVANTSPLPSNEYKPSIPNSISVNSFSCHNNSFQDKSEAKSSKMPRSQSYTMSTLQEGRLLARDEIVVETQVEKPPRGLLGGNKRSISVNSGSSRNNSSKSSLQNGVSNGIGGCNSNPAPPPSKTGSKFRSRAPILKRGSKSESMGSSTDSSTIGSVVEGTVSTNLSTADSGLGTDVSIDGVLEMEILYLTVHQDFFNGKYSCRSNLTMQTVFGISFQGIQQKNESF